MKFVTTTLWISAATCLLGWFLFGSEATSVLETSLARTRDEVGSKLSHEFRVDQAEVQLKSADEEIARQEKRVAELRVQCRELSDEVGDLKARVDSAETQFVQLDEALARTGGGARPVAYRSRLTPAADLENSLERVALTITASASRLEARNAVLESQQAALDTAEQMLHEIRSRRERVAMAIESSRIDLESVRLLQSANSEDVDASSLAAAEALATELAHELSVEREFMVIRDGASRPADLTTLSSKDAVAQVRNRLDRTPALSSPVAKAERTHSGFSR